MKKIAVIGDSHVGMLKKALDKNIIESECAFTFFIWRSTGEKKLVIKGEEETQSIDEIMILPNSNNIVDVTLFDGFLVCGLGFSISNIYLDLYKHFRHDDQAQGKYIISESCWNTAAFGMFHQSLAFDVFNKLQSVTGKNIYLMPTPYGSSRYIDSAPKINIYKTCVGNGDECGLVKHFDVIKSSLKDKGAVIVEQPPETIYKSILTVGKLSKAYPEGNDNQPASAKIDFLHMREEFGAIMLQEFFKKLNLAMSIEPLKTKLNL